MVYRNYYNESTEKCKDIFNSAAAKIKTEDMTMAVLEKSKLFASPKFDPYIKSANTSGSERWLGYFFGPLGAAILNITLISYLNVFYTDVLDLTNSFAWAAAFMALFPILSKFIDAITNIVMGQSQDHHFKWWFDVAPVRGGVLAPAKGGVSKAVYWLPQNEAT